MYDTKGIKAPKAFIDTKPSRFFKLDEWLTNRDSKGRSKTPNIKAVFQQLHPDHLIVIEGILTEDDEWIDGTKYPAGSSWKIDGNSRFEVWANPCTPVNLNDVKELLVIQYHAKSLKELEGVYYRMNSVDASETTKDIYKGIYKSLKDEKGNPWNWVSQKFRRGDISMLMEYAAIKLFPHRVLSVKKAKSDGIETKSKVKIRMRRKQLDQFVISTRVLDHFIRQAEMNKTEKVMRDNPLGAALLGFFWAAGAETYPTAAAYIDKMNPHVRKLIETRLVPMSLPHNLSPASSDRYASSALRCPAGPDTDHCQYQDALFPTDLPLSAPCSRNWSTYNHCHPLNDADKTKTQSSHRS